MKPNTITMTMQNTDCLTRALQTIIIDADTWQANEERDKVARVFELDDDTKDTLTDANVREMSYEIVMHMTRDKGGRTVIEQSPYSRKCVAESILKWLDDFKSTGRTGLVNSLMRFCDANGISGHDHRSP
jgi:hypothetical protein